MNNRWCQISILSLQCKNFSTEATSTQQKFWVKASISLTGMYSNALKQIEIGMAINHSVDQLSSTGAGVLNGDVAVKNVIIPIHHTQIDFALKFG